jgi:hypothetical protein
MRLLQLWADHAARFETRVSFGDRPSLDLRMPENPKQRPALAGR